MSKHLALIVSAERLWPHDSPTTGKPTTFVFGLNLVTAIAGAQSLVAADYIQLKPWLWTSLSNITLFASLPPGPGVPAPVRVSVVPIAPNFDPTQKAALSTAMEARFDALKKASDGNQPFVWDPANPKGDETPSASLYRHFLGSTSTMPAPVPYALNLAACFSVPASSFPAAFLDPVTGQFLSTVTLLAAPTYTTATAGSAGPSATNPQQYPTNNSDIWQWPYTPDTTGTPVMAYTIAMDVDKPTVDTAASYFDLSRYWILNTNGNAVGDDWATYLADAVANAWNLPRLLLDALPKLIQSNALVQPQAYWQAILASLRDRANLGWIDSPDGAGMLRFAATRAAQAILPATGPARAATSLSAVTDGWIRSLRSQLRSYDLAPTTFADWQKTIIAVTPDLDSTPAIGDILSVDSNGATLTITSVNFNGVRMGDSVTVQNSSFAPADNTWVVSSLPNATTLVLTAAIAPGSGGAGGTWTGPPMYPPTPNGGAISGIVGNGGTAVITTTRTAGLYLGEALTIVNSGVQAANNTVWNIISLTPTTITVSSSANGAAGAGGFWQCFDFTPLERIYGALSNNLVLTELLLGDGTADTGLWPQAFAAETISLNATQARQDFIETGMVDSGPTFADNGILDLSDGSLWAITIGEISFAGAWNNQTFSIRLSDQEAGQGAESLRIIVTQASDAALPPNKILNFNLMNAAGAAIGGTFPSGPLTAPVSTYHIRIRIQRDTSDATAFGPVSKFTIGIQVSDTPPPVVNSWTNVALAVLPASIVIGAPMSWVSVSVTNDNLAAPVLTLAPASVISARGANVEQTFNDWDLDQSVNKSFAAWAILKDTITADFPQSDPNSGLNVSRRLALGNIGRVWPMLHTAMMANAANEIQGLQTAFVAQLVAYFSARFNLAADRDNSPYRDYRPIDVPTNLSDNGLITAIRAAINASATNFASTQLVSRSTDQEDSPSPTSQALVLQLERFDAFDDTDPIEEGADKDILRKVAGVGVLMQQALPNTNPAAYGTQWHMLNAAQLYAYDSTQASLYAVVARQVVAPVRVTYRDGVKQPIVSYDNNPMNARSVMTQFADQAHRSIGDMTTTMDANDAGPPSFRYDAITDVGNHPWALLPALKYGQQYRILPYFIGNCGALPRAMVDTGGHPSELTGNNNLPNMTQDVINDCQRTMTYQRRVGIGRPRLATANLIPSYPDGTVPLARELEFTAVTQIATQARFFYSPAKQTGQLNLGASWVLIVPRVIRPGLPLLQANGTDQPTSYAVAIGLQTSGTAAPVAVRARFHREGANATASLQVGPPGSPFPTTTVAVPLTTANQAIDIRLTRVAAGLYIGWRVADVNEDDADGWTDVALPAPTTAPPANWTNGLAVVELLPNDFSPATSVVTFGVPCVIDPSTNTNTPAPRKEPPLLLVAPPADEPAFAALPTVLSQVSLGIRPPATDLQTWDRWFAMNLWQAPSAAMTAVRQRVWARAYDCAKPDGTIDPNKDASIDDPAVSSYVLELVPLLTETTNTNGVPVESAPVSIPTSAALDFKSPPLPIQINVIAAGDPLPSSRLNTVGTPIVTVGEMEIWELRVYPAVLDSYFQSSTTPGANRFYARLAQDRPLYSTTAGNVRLFPPWRIVIEAITTESVLQDPTNNAVEPEIALANGVSIGFDEQTETVAVTLDKTDAYGPRRFRYVSRINLARQVWRWRGRPVDPFPFESASDPTLIDQFPAPTDLHIFKYPMVWDAEGFGDRSGLDLLESSVGVHVADASITLFTEDLSNNQANPGSDSDDPRALYYRVSALAISRYAPLFPFVSTSTQMFLPRPKQNNQGNAWKRLFVPCRYAQAVPRPVVKIVVPLTQAEEGGVLAPGLLAVMDEASFQHGGLAETIEAEVVRVTYTDPNTKAATSWPEFGPDPILSGSGLQGNSALPTSEPLSLEIIGPVGNTFDIGVDAPRFVASMLVVQAPTLATPPPGQSLGWYLARTRFRRVLLAEAMNDYKVPGETSIVPGSPEQQTNLTLSSSAQTDYAITIANIAAQPSATSGQLTVRLGGTAVAPTDHYLVVAMSAGTGAGLSLKFDPVAPPAPNSSFPANAFFGVSGDVRPITMDLRIILQRDPPTGPAAPANTVPNWHFSVSYRVRDYGAATANPTLTLGQWQTLQAFQWPGALPSNMGLTWVGPSSLSLCGPFQNTARVSPFTEPIWVQFLPDSNALIPAPVVNAPTTAGFAWVTLTVFPGENLLQFVTVNQDGTTTAMDWSLQQVPSGDQSKNNFARQVLLTEPIYDVYNRPGQERYLGLYAPDAKFTTVLHAIQTSPILAAAKESVQSIQTVRFRVIELQANADISKPPSDEAVWTSLFGPAQAASPTQASDAIMRIVRVSQPIDLQQQAPPQ